jgi:hypothetical protein
MAEKESRNPAGSQHKMAFNAGAAERIAACVLIR